MEPAGSQGVWSLDDYQFVPFIWGSSQLIMNPKITPDMFTKEDIVDTFAKDYIFLSCIQYILSVSLIHTYTVCQNVAKFPKFT